MPELAYGGRRDLLTEARRVWEEESLPLIRVCRRGLAEPVVLPSQQRRHLAGGLHRPIARASGCDNHRWGLTEADQRVSFSRIRSFMRLAASRCISGNTWAYVFIVSDICECPRMSITTRGDTP